MGLVLAWAVAVGCDVELADEAWTVVGVGCGGAMLALEVDGVAVGETWCGGGCVLGVISDGVAGRVLRVSNLDNDAISCWWGDGPGDCLPLPEWSDYLEFDLNGSACTRVLIVPD